MFANKKINQTHGIGKSEKRKQSRGTRFYMVQFVRDATESIGSHTIKEFH